MLPSPIHYYSKLFVYNIGECRHASWTVALNLSATRCMFLWLVLWIVCATLCTRYGCFIIARLRRMHCVAYLCPSGLPVHLILFCTSDWACDDHVHVYNLYLLTLTYLQVCSVAEWLACWTQAQQSLCSNHSHDAVW